MEVGLEVGVRMEATGFFVDRQEDGPNNKIGQQQVRAPTELTY